MIWDCVGRKNSSFHFFYILLLVISGSIQGTRIWKGTSSFSVLKEECFHLHHWNEEVVAEESDEAHEASSSRRLTAASGYSSCNGLCVHGEPRRGHTPHTRAKGSLTGLTSRQEDSHRARKDTRNKKSWSPTHISIWMFLSEHNVQHDLLSTGYFCLGKWSPCAARTTAGVTCTDGQTAPACSL